MFTYNIVIPWIIEALHDGLSSRDVKLISRLTRDDIINTTHRTRTTIFSLSLFFLTRLEKSKRQSCLHILDKLQCCSITWIYAEEYPRGIYSGRFALGVCGTCWWTHDEKSRRKIFENRRKISRRFDYKRLSMREWKKLNHLVLCLSSRRDYFRLLQTRPRSAPSLASPSRFSSATI